MAHDNGETARLNEVAMINLADGSEVAEPVVVALMMSLELALLKTGIVGATDLTYLVQGKQPPRSPFADTRPVFAEFGVGQLAEDGSLQLHDSEAAVIRNAVHINPNNKLQFAVTSPLLPFKGFDSK